MRISLINLNLLAHDAIGQCVINQARFFQRRGDDVRIYTMHPPQGIPPSLLSLTQQVKNLSPQLDKHFAHSDLYVYHYPGRYPLIESIKSVERGVVLFYYHNITPPALWGSQADIHLLYEAQQGIPELTSYADLIVTVSPFNKEDLIENYSCEADRIRVFPLGVSLERFKTEVDTQPLLEKYNLFGQRIILFVGRMAGNKRPDLLVSTLPLVQQKVPNTKLLLVGSNDGNQAIKETVAKANDLAESLGVTNDVIFTGQVDDLSTYFKAANVYATASLHEGFGVPLIEAMAAGLPIVASQTTAHPWVLGDAGLLVEPENVADLADKVVQILSDDALYGELVQRGLARANQFSLEQYELNWSRVVNEVTALLPNQPYPRLRTISTEAESPVQPSKNELPEINDDTSPASSVLSLDDLETTANIFMHGYAVQSRLPLLGSIIVWFRRNITSHLREPYLDPMLRKQEVFNWQLVSWLKQFRMKWFNQHQETEARLKALETEVRDLRRQLSDRVDKE